MAYQVVLLACPSCGCFGTCCFSGLEDECHNSYHDPFRGKARAE